MNDQPSLNIIGAGNVGKTLAAAWHKAGQVRVQCVLNRSRESADAAVAFIGGGLAIDDMSQWTPAEITLIGCPDNLIRDCAQALSETKAIGPGNIVFHCSGLHSSAELQPLERTGARLASTHPMTSFADAGMALNALPGSFCGIEGNSHAVKTLTELFHSLKMEVFSLDAQTKPLYHAAAVFACNYLVTLQDVALECFAEAGIEPSTGRKLLQPILQGTVANLSRLPPHKALTGPIARGDTRTIASHLQALAAHAPQLEPLYRLLGLRTLPLSQHQGTTNNHALHGLATLLSNRETHS